MGERRRGKKVPPAWGAAGGWVHLPRGKGGGNLARALRFVEEAFAALDRGI